MSSSRVQRFQQTTVPYQHESGGLKLSLNEYVVDDQDPVAITATGTQRRWGLDTEEWAECSIHGTLELPDTTVEKVLHDSERDHPPAKLYVAIRCRDTIYRDRASVAEAPASPGTYDVTISLEREMLRGEVDLVPFYTRTEPAAHEDSRFARQAFAQLATARPWTIVVDGRVNQEGAANLPTETRSFDELRYVGDEQLYYLDVRDPSSPRLLVNADYPRLLEVLQSEGSVGAKARLRDVIFDNISYSVWMQLLLHAGAAVDATGRPQYEWQRTVLDVFVRDLYGVEETREAAIRLRDELQDPARLPEVVARIDRELQRYLGHREQLVNLMEEGMQL